VIFIPEQIELRHPALSPDGRRSAFSYHRELISPGDALMATAGKKINQGLK
jgi:hypothetical protein